MSKKNWKQKIQHNIKSNDWVGERFKEQRKRINNCMLGIKAPNAQSN